MGFWKWAALAALGALAGCAAPPQNIKAVQTGETCTPEKVRRLQELYSVQSATANNDALGVFLIGLPMGSMGGGDHKEEIARLKGACGDRIAGQPVAPPDGRHAIPPAGQVKAAM